MKFILIINTSNSYSALKFAETVIKLNHQLQMIFFYQDGVKIANKFINLLQDEINIQNNWQEFSEHNSVKLFVCSTSALRNGLQLEQLAENFNVGSLGQLIEEISNANKVISFK